MTKPPASPMASESAIASLQAHIEEFIALKLTHKLDAQLARLVRSCVLDLDN